MKRYARVLLLFLIFLLVIEVAYFPVKRVIHQIISREFGPDDVGDLVLIVLVPAAAVLYIFTLFRHRALLRDGSVAMGRITATFHGRGVYPLYLQPAGRNVAFEFTDSQMRIIRGKRVDRDRSAHASMAMPIFYDPNNSKHNLPLCSSFYELSPSSAGK